MSDQVDFCCRLCEKAIDDFKRIHILTEQSLQNEALDTALWTFKAESFLPHEVGQEGEPKAPIVIDTKELKQDSFQESNLLILLGNTLPANIDRFDRLCIVVPNHESDIQQARELYKQLAKENIEVHIHDRR